MNLDTALRIAIFDNNKNTRNNMTIMLNAEQMFEVVGTYSNVQNCVKDLLISKPDLVLMDIVGSGMNAVENLKKELEHIQILILTSSVDDIKIYNSILAGVSGYLLKKCINKTLIHSINELRMGGFPMSPLIAHTVLNMIKQSIHHNSKIKMTIDYKLTKREKDVLTHIVKGKSYKMIGYDLSISCETVRSHIKKIYKKLQVTSLTEVVAKAIYQNIV